MVSAPGMGCLCFLQHLLDWKPALCITAMQLNLTFMFIFSTDHLESTQKLAIIPVAQRELTSSIICLL